MRFDFHTPPRAFLAVELAVLFVGLPLLFVVELVAVPKLSALMALTGYCVVFLHREGALHQKESWRIRDPVGGTVRRLALRAALITAGLVALAVVLVPEQLFAFPRQRPALWLLVMGFYPFLSALPQEVIYRAFFLRRYQALFGTTWVLLLTNAAVFAFLHLVYDNWVAVTLSFGGGCLFAFTYARTRSLALVTLEHALYGLVIFTVGLGRFFYEG